MVGKEYGLLSRYGGEVMGTEQIHAMIYTAIICIISISFIILFPILYERYRKPLEEVYKDEIEEFISKGHHRQSKEEKCK